jgi:hypothetical protein
MQSSELQCLVLIKLSVFATGSFVSSKTNIVPRTSLRHLSASYAPERGTIGKKSKADRCEWGPGGFTYGAQYQCKDLHSVEQTLQAIIAC